MNKEQGIPKEEGEERGARLLRRSEFLVPCSIFPSNFFLPPSNVLGLAVLACVAMFALHAPSLWYAMLWFDDFPIVVGSWTWADVRANLWLPFNEHTMPLGRMTTWALAGRPTSLPLATACQGPVAVLLGMVLVYLFVRRETGQPFHGLLAMTFFGVTTVYNEAVSWFAASFTLLALDTLLLGLLAAQRWRQTGRWYYLAASAFWAALAPAWFASGILAGPLCSLYLLPPEPRQRHLTLGRLAALVPLAGSALFLAVSLPFTAEHILHLEHYGDKTAVDAFDLGKGMENTARSLVDSLLLGTFGVSGRLEPGEVVWGWEVDRLLPWTLGFRGVPLSPGAVRIGLDLLVIGAAWWWWRAEDRRLLLLGLGFILISDLLIFSARAEWDYEQVVTWLRYNLYPHLGLTLFLCGGLQRAPADFRAEPLGGISGRQVKVLVLLTAVLLAINLPRSLVVAVDHYRPEQMQVLRHIEEVDALCRERHISAADARAALPPLRVPFCGDDSNGWKLLRGSPEPRPVTPPEARRLLEP